eukprot:18775-Heterococcus_DN1.PRE.3
MSFGTALLAQSYRPVREEERLVVAALILDRLCLDAGIVTLIWQWSSGEQSWCIELYISAARTVLLIVQSLRNCSIAHSHCPSKM